MKKENKPKGLKVTYKELEVVLKKLGYKRKVREDAIVFFNKKFDSIILLTKKRRNAIVFPPQIYSEAYIMYMKGVIEEEEDLPKMILKERELKKNAQAAA